MHQQVIHEGKKYPCRECDHQATSKRHLTHSSDLFPLNKHQVNTRNKEKYYVATAHTSRFAKSAIPYMQRLLNDDWHKQCR